MRHQSHPANAASLEGRPPFGPQCGASQGLLALVLGVLFAGLAAAGVVWWLRGSGANDARPYLPDDCVMVTTIQAQDVLKGELFRDLGKDYPEFRQEFDKMEKETGFKPEDLKSATIALGGSLDGPTQPDMIFVLRLARASSPKEIQDLTRQKQSAGGEVKWEEEKVNGVVLYEALRSGGFMPAQRGEGAAFCMPEKTLVVFSSKSKSLEKVLRRGKDPKLAEGMVAALKTVQPSSTVTIAVDVQSMVRNSRLSKELDRGQGRNDSPIPGFNPQILRDLTAYGVDLNLKGYQLDSHAVVTCTTKEAATDLRKMVEGVQVFLKNLMKGQKDAPREALEALESLKVEVNGTSVTMACKMDMKGIMKSAKENMDRQRNRTRGFQVQ